MAGAADVGKYPDLRYRFIRYLIKYEQYQRKHHFLKTAAESTSRAIVSLDLCDEPIRSAKQAKQLCGVGAAIVEKLKGAELDARHSLDPPEDGKYISSGSALLVALYNLTEEAELAEPDAPFHVISEDNLRNHCLEICKERFLPPSSTALAGPVLCPALWRINVLKARNYVKKRAKDKEPAYQLLPLGREVAERLKRRYAHKSQGFISSTNHVQNCSDALYTNDHGGDGVVLVVDTREGGGDNRGLLNFCNLVSQHGITYKAKQLACGDYQWFCRRNGEEFRLPVIAERKRVDDVAESMKDGRYERQKRNMLEWRSSFTDESIVVQLLYIIEGSANKYVVRCGHECIGKCGNPSLVEVVTAISELEADDNFTVIKTRNTPGSIKHLSTITKSLEQRFMRGELDGHIRQVPSLPRLTSPEKAVAPRWCDYQSTLDPLTFDVGNNSHQVRASNSRDRFSSSSESDCVASSPSKSPNTHQNDSFTSNHQTHDDGNEMNSSFSSSRHDDVIDITLSDSEESQYVIWDDLLGKAIPYKQKNDSSPPSQAVESGTSEPGCSYQTGAKRPCVNETHARCPVRLRRSPEKKSKKSERLTYDSLFSTDLLSQDSSNMISSTRDCVSEDSQLLLKSTFSINHSRATSVPRTTGVSISTDCESSFSNRDLSEGDDSEENRVIDGSPRTLDLSIDETSSDSHSIDESKILQLREMFPEHDEADLRKYLMESNSDVHRVIDRLLQ